MSDAIDSVIASFHELCDVSFSDTAATLSKIREFHNQKPIVNNGESLIYLKLTNFQD